MTNSFLLVCLSSARITDTKSKRMWTDPPPVAFSFAGLKLGWSFTCAFSFTTPTFPLGTHVNRRDASPPPHCVTTCRNNSLQSHCDYWGWVWFFFYGRCSLIRPAVSGCVQTSPKPLSNSALWFQPFSKYCANTTSTKTTHCASLLLSCVTPNTST